MNIFQFRRNLREVRDNLKDTARIVIISSESQDLIVELQTEQLMHGKDSTGGEIAPSYRNNAYADYKHAKNPLAGHGTPDLRLTGDFHRAIYFDTNKMQPTSDDPKTPSLEEKYSNNGKNPIFGLNEESLQKYRPEFKQKLIGEIKAQLSEE